MKKSNAAQDASKFPEPEFGTITSVFVKNVRQYKQTVFFTLDLNGVAINNCRVVEGKNGDFISLPQEKSKDGNYYNVVWFKFSDHDRDIILDMVQQQLNEA